MARHAFGTHGTSLGDRDRRTAIHVDKILKGVKPAELPVEQLTKLELVIHPQTTKQIGLAIPHDVLARADKNLPMTPICNCREQYQTSEAISEGLFR